MEAESSIKVLIVDDHPLFRDGVTALLSKQDDMIVIAEAENGAEAIEKARLLSPDVILLDLQMPGLSGAEAIPVIRRETPAAKVVILTTYKGDVRVTDALAAGASGYVLKDAARKDLANVIRDVHEGRIVVPPEVAMDMASLGRWP